MEKGITPIISVVLLLLITMALASIGYYFFYSYQVSIAGRTMIVTNGLCQNGTKAVIFLRSIGTEVITLSDVIVMDLSEGGGMINESEWKTPNGSQVLAQLPPGESVMYVANCSGDCVFRFFTGSMGTQTIPVNC